MFLEGRPAVAAAEPIEPNDDAGPVFERVAAERPDAVAVGVGVHLVRDDDREVVFPRQREQLGDLAGDRPQGVTALGVGRAVEPVEAGRAVEDDQVDAVGELGGVGDGLALLVEIHRVGDDEPRGDGLDRFVGSRVDELSKPVD